MLKTSLVHACSTTAMVHSVGAVCPANRKTSMQPMLLQWNASIQTHVIRTATTGSGFVTLKRTNWLLVPSAVILYQDAYGRTKIALKFNEMVRQGKIGPVMLGRDHHDTSGTDSTFRETSNIKDGSNIMADMAVQCFAGNCARGMSWLLCTTAAVLVSVKPSTAVSAWCATVVSG